MPYAHMPRKRLGLPEAFGHTDQAKAAQDYQVPTASQAWPAKLLAGDRGTAGNGKALHVSG